MKIIAAFLLFSVSSLAVIERKPQSDGSILYIDSEKRIFVYVFEDGTFAAYRPYLDPFGSSFIQVYGKEQSEDLFKNYDAHDPMDVDPKN